MNEENETPAVVVIEAETAAPAEAPAQDHTLGYLTAKVETLEAQSLELGARYKELSDSIGGVLARLDSVAGAVERVAETVEEVEEEEEEEEEEEAASVIEAEAAAIAAAPAVPAEPVRKKRGFISLN